MKRILIWTIACILPVFLSGCARSTVRYGINYAGPELVNGMVEGIQNSKSIVLAKEGFAGNLLMITGLVEMTPDNRELLDKCAFLYCAYGMFMEDEDPEYAKTLYTIGKDYGMRSLKQKDLIRNALLSGEKPHEILHLFGPDDVPALSWTSFNWGLFMMLSLDDPMALMGMADTIAMVKRSVELDPDFFFGVGKAFLAAYYAMVPEYLGLGGGPENALSMFQEAEAVTNGKFLLVDVFKARYYASTLDDLDLYRNLLEKVLEADPGTLDGGRLLNELAQVKAGFYLQNEDQYF